MDPVGPITDLFRTINYVEAGLWAILGVGFAIGAGRAGGRAARWRCVIAALTLLAFGASDVVETRTGAWWHPWWLLAWKAACVIALLLLVIGWWRTSRRPKLP